MHMRLTDIDGSFDQLKITRLRHQLADHPLMTTQSLAELALRLDPDYVRFHDGERRVDTHMGAMLLTDDHTRQRLRKAIDNLHKAKAFVQILNVRSDPAYRALIDDFLDEVSPFLPPRDRQMLNRDSAAFLASPGSVTPFHLDHEQNFLCHIRGAKTFHVWDHRDRSVVTERALEIFYREGKLREVVYQPEMQAKAQSIELAPGDCLFMPMGSPHAASTGSDITVTISILMNTQSSFDLVETYRANHVLRSLGLSPAPVGDSQVRDSLKRHTLEAVRRVRNLARGRTTERRVQWY
jgi:ribosomal protein L16 Arg81 hydroxylase